MTLKQNLYTALHDHYIAKRNKAIFQMNLAFEKPVAVGDHPQIVDDCIKLVDEIATADESLEVLKDYFGEMND
jgi:methylaspartate ammonia-lyase